MAIDPTGISEGIQAAIGIGETVVGFVNKGKANREAAQLEKTRPKYKIASEFGEDVDLTSSELSNGIGADAKRAYDNATVGSESNSLSALLKGGGGVNSVGAIYGSGEGGRENLAILRDNTRLNQIQNLIAARTAEAQEKQTQWQVNDYDLWKDKTQANAAARQGAEDQIWSGIGTAGSAGMNYAQNKTEQSKYGLTTTTDNSTDDVPRIPSYSRTPVSRISATSVSDNNNISPSSYQQDIYFPFSQKNLVSNLE